MKIEKLLEVKWILSINAYLDLINKRDMSGSIYMLWEKVAPLIENREELSKLSSLLMQWNFEDSFERLGYPLGWEERSKQLLQTIQPLIPDMLPENRLVDICVEAFKNSNQNSKEIWLISK